MKDMDKKWMKVGTAFRTFLSDIRRVWPGAGQQGLVLLQVGVSVPLNDLSQPHIPVSKTPENFKEFSDDASVSDTDLASDVADITEVTAERESCSG